MMGVDKKEAVLAALKSCSFQDEAQFLSEIQALLEPLVSYDAKAKKPAAKAPKKGNVLEAWLVAAYLFASLRRACNRMGWVLDSAC